MTRSRRLLILSGLMALCAILQAYGLARYLGRLPQDNLGIGLYAATLLAFLIAAVGLFVSRNRPGS